jgi:hypothetical protein
MTGWRAGSRIASPYDRLEPKSAGLPSCVRAGWVTILVGSSKINVEAHAGDGDGAARLIVAGIIDVLQVEGREEAAPEMRGVEAFEDFFGAVGQPAIAEQEAETAQREILLMRGDDSVGDKDGAGAINSLMGELLEDHIRNHMPRNSKSSEEAANDVIEIVRTYLK